MIDLFQSNVSGEATHWSGLRAGGGMKFYLLRCGGCDLDMPFPDNATRADWLAGHLETGHETYLLWCVAR